MLVTAVNWSDGDGYRILFDRAHISLCRPLLKLLPGFCKERRILIKVDRAAGKNFSCKQQGFMADGTSSAGDVLPAVPG